LSEESFWRLGKNGNVLGSTVQVSGTQACLTANGYGFLSVSNYNRPTDFPVRCSEPSATYSREPFVDKLSEIEDQAGKISIEPISIPIFATTFNMLSIPTYVIGYLGIWKGVFTDFIPAPKLSTNHLTDGETHYYPPISFLLFFPQWWCFFDNGSTGG